jgi:phosphate-selective porin OprO/OprP
MRAPINFVRTPIIAFAALMASALVASAQTSPFAGDRVVPAAAPATDEAEIRRIVEQTIKERDEKAKAEAEAKKNEPKSWTIGANPKMTGTWKNGLQFESEDKAFKFNVGGVNQFDIGFYNANKSQVRSIGTLNNLVDPGNTLQDGMDFRRARLRMSGLAYEQIEFFAQYEFANALDLRQRSLGIPNEAGVPDSVAYNFDPAEGPLFNEVYIGLVKLPYVGNVRVGRHRESLNFVTATADNNQVWMERGLMFEAFNASYNFSQGITMSRTYFDDRAYTLFGLFMQNNNNGRHFATVGDGLYAYDGRVTCLPVWDEEEQLWVHLGVDYSYRNLSRNTVRYRARPDIRVGSAFQVPNIADSGNIFSRDAQQIANLEFAMAWGPWTCAAEGTASTVTNAYTGALPSRNGELPEGAKSRGTYTSTGGYVELLRFLTPDHRSYVKERPGYARVTPSSNFFLLEGDDGHTVFDTGGWEIGVRYDYIDLTHGGINGGTAQGVTGALNWYLSSNARIQMNYTWMTRTFGPRDTAGRLPGELTALGIRFNCDF